MYIKRERGEHERKRGGKKERERRGVGGKREFNPLGPIIELLRNAFCLN